MSAVFGLPFDDATMADVLHYIDASVRTRKPRYITTANLDFATQAASDVELQRIIYDADLNLCDGVPLMWASKGMPRPIQERIAGADLVPELLSHSSTNGYRVFILGAAEEVLTRALQRARRDNPDLLISGYSPPPADLDSLDNETIHRRILAAHPDILLVAMGCPKQEKWISRNHQALGVPISIGVGASIDFLAGETRRAPEWMQRVGAEWVFRLTQDPRRLGGRYARDLRFYGRAMIKAAGTRFATTATARNAPLRATVHPAGTDAVTLTWSGSFDGEHIGNSKLPMPRLDGVREVFVDCRRVTHMDSAGVGELIKVLRESRRTGVSFAVREPSAAAKRAITEAGLDRLVVQQHPFDSVVYESCRLLSSPDSSHAGGGTSAVAAHERT